MSVAFGTQVLQAFDWWMAERGDPDDGGILGVLLHDDLIQPLTPDKIEAEYREFLLELDPYHRHSARVARAFLEADLSCFVY